MTTVFGSLGRLAGIAAVLGVVAAAQANNFITFTGSYGPDNVFGIKYDHGTKHINAGNVVVGFLKFQDNSGQGLPNPFEALCGDIIDDISGGDKYSDTISHTNPSYTGAAPSIYTTAAAVTSAGHIVGRLFDNVLAGGNNDQAAALQVAVWTTLYDSAYTGQTEAQFDSMITTTGELTFYGAQFNSTVKADAYLYWSNNAAGFDSLFLDGGGKVIGSGTDGQDQFTTVTQYNPPSGSPEPFTMGIGAAGVLFAVRRRMKRSN